MGIWCTLSPPLVWVRLASWMVLYQHHGKRTGAYILSSVVLFGPHHWHRNKYSFNVINKVWLWSLTKVQKSIGMHLLRCLWLLLRQPDHSYPSTRCMQQSCWHALLEPKSSILDSTPPSLTDTQPPYAITPSCVFYPLQCSTGHQQHFNNILRHVNSNSAAIPGALTIPKPSLLKQSQTHALYTYGMGYIIKLYVQCIVRLSLHPLASHRIYDHTVCYHIPISFILKKINHS